MTALFEEFCEMLSEELTRQENVRAALDAQADALDRREIEALEGATRKLRDLSREALPAERWRKTLLDQVTQALGLSGEQQNLSNIIKVIEEPWKGRLAALQQHLKATLVAVEPRVRNNTAMLRASARTVEQAVSALSAGGIESPGYDRIAERQGYTARQPSFIDQRG